MTRPFRLLIALPVVAGSILFGLWGVFALIYNGDNNRANTYVTLLGYRTDAHFAGATGLAIALAVIFVCFWFIRRPTQ